MLAARLPNLVFSFLLTSSQLHTNSLPGIFFAWPIRFPDQSKMPIGPNHIEVSPFSGSIFNLNYAYSNPHAQSARVCQMFQQLIHLRGGGRGEWRGEGGEGGWKTESEGGISSLRRMRERPEGWRREGRGGGGDRGRRQARFLIRADHSQQP